MPMLPGSVRILIGAEALRTAQRVGHGCHSGAGHHLRNQAHTLAVVVTGEVRGDHLFDGIFAMLADMSSKATGCRVTIIFAAGRIRRPIVQIGHLQCQRICPGRVSAAMLDKHWMIGDGSIEILKSERAPFGRFRVVVFKAQNPLARRCLGGALSQGLQDVGDGTQVAVHHPQMREAGFCRVRVRVNETGQNGLAAEINLLRIAGSERKDFLVRSDRQKSVVGNGNGLRPRLARVHRPEIAVVEDKLGLRPLQGK